MRRFVLLCFSLAMVLAFGQDSLERIVLNSSFYKTVSTSQFKLTILDAINLTNEKDVVTAYLSLVGNNVVWIVLTFKHEYGISAVEQKILWKKPIEIKPFTYSVGLREAISLTVMSIGKNILFGAYRADNWVVGNNEKLAFVSMKTPAILRIDSTQEIFKQVQQEMLRKQKK